MNYCINQSRFRYCSDIPKPETREEEWHTLPGASNNLTGIAQRSIVTCKLDPVTCGNCHIIPTISKPINGDTPKQSRDQHGRFLPKRGD